MPIYYSLPAMTCILVPDSMEGGNNICANIRLFVRRFTHTICSAMEMSPFSEKSALSPGVNSHWIPTHQTSILINTSRHSTSFPYHSPFHSRCYLRCPSNEAAATGSTVLCAALSVCTDWPDYAPATAAIRLALKAHLQFLSPDALCSSTSLRSLAEFQTSLQIHQASERVSSRYSVRMPAPKLLYA